MIPTPTGDKPFSRFQTVRDTKVAGYHNLRAALVDRQPQLWVNIGSVAGFFGMPGDTDYSSANDFLAACARSSPARELTISFPLWADVGLGATPINKSFLERQGRITGISTDEGIAIFLNELRARPGDVVYLGDREERLYRLAADARQDRATSHTARPNPHLRTLHSLTATSAHYSCLFTPELDAYLHDHLVDGKPTVPGTMMLEIAAQAAENFHPDFVTWGFRDAQAHAFICPFTTRAPLRLDIRVTDTPRHRGDPEGTRRVGVVLSADIATRTGQVLRRDRTHFTTDVLLGPPTRDPVLTAPVTKETELRTRHISGPYYSVESPVQLTGPFRATRDAHYDDRQALSCWAPSLSHDPFLEFARTPFIMMCAAARTYAIRPVQPGNQGIFVPKAMGRIDLYCPGENDHTLTAAHGPGIRLRRSDGSFRAITATGQVLTRDRWAFAGATRNRPCRELRSGALSCPAGGKRWEGRGALHTPTEQLVKRTHFDCGGVRDAGQLAVAATDNPLPSA